MKVRHRQSSKVSDGQFTLKKLLNGQGYAIKKVADKTDGLNAAQLGALILNTSKPISVHQEALLQQYMTGGGNLLVLADSQMSHNFTALSHQLGLTVNPHIIQQQTAGLNDDAHQAVYANYYAQHAITQQFSLKNNISCST